MDDNSIMTNGKYRFWKLRDIPAEYFLNIWKTSKGGGDQELRKYITENLQEIYRREREIKETKLPPPQIVPFICDKKTFATEKLARESLKKIRNSEGDHQKPIRVYECPDCSGWHLTSVPIEIFKSISKEIK